MSNKVALITGSTSGIGLGIATRLAQAGHSIVLNGFGDAEQIRQTVAHLRDNYKVKVLYCASNLVNPGEITNMIHLIHKEFGRLDILVNNAGIQYVAPIEDFPEEKWDQILAINLSSAFHTIRHSFAMMKERRWGRIINIASAHALVASPFKSAYVAAKHGIAGLTKTIALEGAEFGVTCNAICPGYVLTPLVEGQIDDTAKARGINRDAVIKDVILAAQPTKEFVKVEDIAELANYLCTDSAAAITGAMLPIDGAWTAR